MQRLVKKARGLLKKDVARLSIVVPRWTPTEKKYEEDAMKMEELFRMTSEEIGAKLYNYDFVTVKERGIRKWPNDSTMILAGQSLLRTLDVSFKYKKLYSTRPSIKVSTKVFDESIQDCSH
jgi:hypothetical protein